MVPTLEVSRLCKTFGTLQAVRDLSFTAYAGEVIALLGPNGAGKSTLMNMISGYLAPSGGQIKILGQNINEDSLRAKKSIGFLPEGSPLYPDLSVCSFLRYMGELRGLSGSALKNRLAQTARLAQIENIWNQRIETLSKGYARRVGFAQSLLSDPPILLLDEPTDGLDPNQKEHIRTLIREMGKHKTIIISTHLLEEAETVAGRIMLMNAGEIKADGQLSDILAADRMARDFVCASV